MSRKPVIITAAIVVFSMIFAMVFMSMNEEDINTAMTAFRGSTQDTPAVKTETVIHQIEKDKLGTQLGELDSDDPDIYAPGMPVGDPSSDWIDILRTIHIDWKNQIGYYQLGGHHTITKSDGSTVTVRTDCSGYISYCLYHKGLLATVDGISSKSGSTGGSIAGVNAFPPSSLSDWSDLQPGDIVFYTGHVEAIAETPAPGSQGSDKPIVYNWGGTASATVDYESRSGHTFSQITNIWRVP